MSYDAPGVPHEPWVRLGCGAPWGHCASDCTTGHVRFKLSVELAAFDFGLLAAPELRTGRFVLVFECGCTRVIDRAGQFYEYPHVWLHAHFVDR